MRKPFGFILGLLLIMSSVNLAVAEEELLFEGYLNKGDSILVGPLVVVLQDVQKDYEENEYKAMILILRDNKVLNMNYTSVKVPNPEKIQKLLTNVTFLYAMAKTLGYNTANPIELAQFYLWLNSASQKEILDAVFKTVEEHPELGISKEDLLMTITYPNIELVGENETIEVEVDGEKVTITALQIYPNGAKISISGPSEWKASMIPAYLRAWAETPKKVRPGDEITIKVHIKNEGALKAKFITVVVSPTPVSFVPSSGGAEAIAQIASQSGVVQSVLLPVDSAVKYIEYLDGKEEKVVEFRFKVNENIDPGIYPLYISLAYYVQTGEKLQMLQGFDYFSVSVIREGEATFEIENVEKPEVVHPGEDFEITVDLRNVGLEPAKEILVDLSPSLEFQKGAILIDNATKQHFTYTINTNRVMRYTFRLHVSEDASTGSYPLRLKVSYYSGDSKDQREQTFDFSIQVVRRNQAFVEIESVEMDPKAIEPGDEFVLRVKVKNVGDETAKAFSFRIEPSEVNAPGEVTKVDLSALQNLPVQGSQSLSENLQLVLNQLMEQLARENINAFLPIGEDNTKYLSKLGPGEERVLEFHLKASERLENGVYPLKVSLEYLSTPNDDKLTDERLIGVPVLGREHIIISKVSTSPSRVLSGTNNVEINFEIENIGTGSARYVILKPMPEDPFELSETSEQIINIGTLRQGDSAKATFKVNVKEDARGGTYEIPVKIEYKDASGNTKEDIIKIPIIVNEKPKITVEKVSFDKTPMQGEEVLVHIKVKNIGGEQAENVIIEGVVKADQPFTLSKRSDYIGTLDPGQEGEGVLELSIANDAIPKDYTIQVRIRAVGDKESGDDNVYIFEESITIPVKENTKTKSSLRTFGVIVGILALVVILWTYRKGKKK
ncbi:COG1361 S-layer family protein [Thermococcus aggregans]|uniref:COG1361 S-layer family protein n=1 Tax=Thermococcus aggregans TaxID=110163 RepID=A0A9E7MYN3_THEAG|nr:COG1361 S-layer family protein [Thermococcus aggregans]USS41209.1 COG1361 S-layer family protein [Thermococcus aggregans]